MRCRFQYRKRYEVYCNVGEVKQMAGGEDGYKALASFIQTHAKNIIDGFNAAIQTGNLNQIRLTIDGLKAQMTTKYGTTGSTIMAGQAGQAAASSGYTSMDQMTKDMADPRYQTDPAFTRTVYAKIKASSIFG